MSEPLRQTLMVCVPWQNAEDRFVQVKGVLQQQFVHGGSCRVGRAALGNRLFTKALRINIEVAAGQQHSLRRGKQPGHTILPLMQRHKHGHCAGRVQRGQIRR